MNMRLSKLAVFVLFLIISTSSFAATFVVPPDRDLIHRADAIVVATALPSFSRLTDEGAIETVTPMRIEEKIKGGQFGDSLEVVEPGGTFGDESSVIAGAPQFGNGDRVLLLLESTGKDRWSVTELVLGKFTFTRDGSGRGLLTRDEGEIIGWDSNLQPHREPRRAADKFLEFVRTEAAGGMGRTDYEVPVSPITPSKPKIASNATYTATSYTMTISGNQGSRWNVFPSAVNFYTGNTEPGAPGGGVTAVQAAFASWNNDPNSNVNYVYAGVDTTHAQGLHAADNVNSVLFERDLSAWGVAPFTCSGNSYSGTLGLGGITSATGSNTVNGETFVTTKEGDVEMNRGLANCTLLFNNGDFNSAVTHEVGHTLGFRHSDQNRASSAACTTDATLECSSSAIMKSFVAQGLNAALQPWDQHAVDAVYPGTTTPPPPACTTPQITRQPQSTTITSGQSVTLTVAATGTTPFTYQWYDAANTPLATTASLTVSPTTTTGYWVQINNACGRANSTVATVTVTSSTPPPGPCVNPQITQHPQSTTINSGQSATLTVAASGTQPFTYQWFDSANNPVGTGATLTVSPTKTTGYWVQVSNACWHANSNVATVTVSSSSPPPPPPCTIPTITQHPQSTTINQGQSATLTVSASGTQPFTYQWFDSANNPVGTASTLTVSPSKTTGYWVQVSNACWHANSNVATVTVSSSSPGPCVIPQITQNPTSRTITRGQSTTLTVAASGTQPFTYQWFDNLNNPVGGNSSSLTVSPTQTTGYWVQVSNACWHANSNVATVTVN
jgi:hypothetical protein